MNIPFKSIRNPEKTIYQKNLVVKLIDPNPYLLLCPEARTQAGFYRMQYPASYTHKSLGRTGQFTLADAEVFVVPFIKIPNSKVIL